MPEIHQHVDNDYIFGSHKTELYDGSIVGSLVSYEMIYIYIT